MPFYLELFDQPFPNVVGSTPDLVTLNPENLSFTLNKGEHGPSEIYFELSRSRAAVGPDSIGPYRTYFRLSWDSVPIDLGGSPGVSAIMEGPITMVQINSREEHIKYSGKDWLHLFERYFWPFNPANVDTYKLGKPSTTDFEPEPGFAYKNADTTTNIITDLVDFVLGQSNSLSGCTCVFNGSGFGTVQELEVSLIDTESLYSKIQTLSQGNDCPFDFFINPDDRNLEMWGPGQYSVTSALASPAGCLHHFDADVETSGIYDINYTNTGPGCNWLLGTGNTASREITARNQYAAAQVTYGLLQQITNFSGVKTKDRLEALNRQALLLNLNPIHEVELVILYDNISGFWVDHLYWPGKAIWLTADLEGHVFDSAHEIISMSVDTTNQDNTLVNMKLNKIYAASTITS